MLTQYIASTYDSFVFILSSFFLQVKRQLKETLELPTLYAPLYRRAPIKLPSGVMLYGPPGCGKTMLASAVAAECGLHFISVKGPEILDKYIGGSEQNVSE